MKALAIIVGIVLVAGLLIGLAPEQVWDYILGIFTECAQWFCSTLKQLIESVRSSAGIGWGG